MPLSDVTQILAGLKGGGDTAPEELLPLVYGELRQLAAAKMARETPGNTLQPTALVHEAWLRLIGPSKPSFEGRVHFFAAAAEAMRRILIDRARRKRATRHGGALERAEWNEEVLAAETAGEEEMLAVHEALDELALLNPREAELVKLRYFVGMTLEESAKAMGISARTADNYWAHARAWLYREIKKKRQP